MLCVCKHVKLRAVEFYVPTTIQVCTILQLLPCNDELGQWCFNYQLLNFGSECLGTDWHLLLQHTLALLLEHSFFGADFLFVFHPLPSPWFFGFFPTVP